MRDEVIKLNEGLELELDLEVYEVSSSTVLETLGASQSPQNSCSVVITNL